MADVTIGKGKLAGKGVYAARDFAEGELVVPYNLKKLTQTEYDKLPVSEREWTHSFWGEIYLFPEPGRYVNHDDNPSTLPDLERMGDYALRPIKKGEAITINDKIELQHELETFLQAYEKATNSHDFDNVAPLIADEAIYWFTNGAFEGKAAIRNEFGNTWQNIQGEIYSITDVKWVAKNYWVSACTYKFEAAGKVNGKYEVYKGRGTNVLARLNGSWRVVHEHVSKLPEARA